MDVFLKQAIAEAVQAQADARSRLIEEYCEKSLTDPEQRGVLIREYWPSFKIEVELSKDVPYGQIHHKNVYGRE